MRSVNGSDPLSIWSPLDHHPQQETHSVQTQNTYVPQPETESMQNATWCSLIFSILFHRSLNDLYMPVALCLVTGHFCTLTNVTLKSQ